MLALENTTKNQMIPYWKAFIVQYHQCHIVVMLLQWSTSMSAGYFPHSLLSQQIYQSVFIDTGLQPRENFGIFLILCHIDLKHGPAIKQLLMSADKKFLSVPCEYHPNTMVHEYTVMQSNDIWHFNMIFFSLRLVINLSRLQKKLVRQVLKTQS